MKNKMKKCITVTLLVLLLTGCGNIPKLKDGTELIVEMDGIKMTTEEFYQKLKDTYGTYTVINSIDELLLNKVYETDSDMTTKVENQITTLKNQFGSDFEDAIYYYYGVSTEKQLYSYIEMAYKREFATKDYAETLITDKEIKEYYDTKAIGDMKISHILIKSEATNDMTDDEKTKAEEKALATAKEVIKKLDDGEKFADLAKKYSGDSSASDGGNVGYINRGETVSEFEEAAVALEVGKYTEEPVKTTYGYHIILKTEQKEKSKLEDIKEDIKDTLADKLITNTSNITTYAMEWLREENNLKIYDAELKIKYDHYMNEQKTKTDTTTTTTASE